MLDLKLDIINGGDLQLNQVTGIPVEEKKETELVRQRLWLTLNSWRGDWPLDQNFGIDYINILGQKRKPTVEALLTTGIRLVVRRAIPGLSIRRIKTNFVGETRKFTLDLFCDFQRQPINIEGFELN